MIFNGTVGQFEGVVGTYDCPVRMPTNGRTRLEAIAVQLSPIIEFPELEIVHEVPVEEYANWVVPVPPAIQ